MKFSLQTLFILTTVVAAAAGFLRLTGPLGAIGLVILGYCFAPLLLGLFASFFRRVDPRFLVRTGYVLLLAAISLIVFLGLIVGGPPGGLLIGFVTAFVWIPQLPLFEDAVWG